MKRVPFELEEEESKDINNEVIITLHNMSLDFSLDSGIENSQSSQRCQIL